MGSSQGTALAIPTSLTLNHMVRKGLCCEPVLLGIAALDLREDHKCTGKMKGQGQA